MRSKKKHRGFDEITKATLALSTKEHKGRGQCFLELQTLTRVACDMHRSIYASLDPDDGDGDGDDEDDDDGLVMNRRSS